MHALENTKSKLNIQLTCVYYPCQGEDDGFNTRNRSTHFRQKSHAAIISPAHMTQLNDERNKKEETRPLVQ
jgi:hypothetical protein